MQLPGYKSKNKLGRKPAVKHVVVAVPALRRIVVLAPVLTVVREYLDRLTLCQTTVLMAARQVPFAS